MSQTNTMALFVGAGLLLAMSGCSSSTTDYQMVDVHGTVTMDGKPLANAKVQFFPVRPPGAPKTLVFEDSEGPTDADGKFTLRGVHGKAGAMAGKHTVIVTKLVTSDGKDVPPVGDQSLIAPISKQVIPPVYSDLSQTTLTADVPDKGGAVDLALRAKP